MRHLRIGLFVLLVISHALVPCTRASAQEGGEKLKLGASMVLDFGGGIEYDRPGRANGGHDSARVTPGFRLHADYDVHRYVSVGGLLRFGFWRSNHRDESRNMLVDIAARVNGHYDYRDFRIYGALSLGPTFNHMRSENRNGLDNPGVGVAVAIAPGIEWWFSRRFAAFTEILGWSGHYFAHDYHGAPGKLRHGLNQVLWQVGMLVGI